MNGNRGITLAFDDADGPGADLLEHRRWEAAEKPKKALSEARRAALNQLDAMRRLILPKELPQIGITG